MRCPKCRNLDTRVIDSRMSEDGKTIRRRRECEKCGARFTTFERMEFVNFIVTKSDGSEEFYDRGKVQRSIEKALYKRQIDRDQIEAMINELESEWAANKKEISSKRIGRDILRKLKDIDEVAFVRFAGIYHNFDDIPGFLRFMSDEFSEQSESIQQSVIKNIPLNLRGIATARPAPGLKKMPPRTGSNGSFPSL